MKHRRFLLLLAIVIAGCTRHKSARRPIMMVPLPPPTEPAHSQASVPAGGAATFDADEVVSCEAEPPGYVRAYATPEALTIVGLNAGRTTLRLRIAAGDVFYVDVDVTTDVPPYHTLTIGEQLALPLEGVRDVGVATDCIRTTKSTDGTQLFVVGEKACSTLLPLILVDGSTKPVEIVVIGGQRIL